MSLDNELKIDIAAEATKIVTKRILGARSVSELRTYLKSIELEELMPDIDNYQQKGEIYILGDLSIKDDVVYGIFKDLSIDVSRVKILKEYEKLTNYNFNNFQYSTSVSLIIAGPTPHSAVGKGDYSSIIARMEQEEGFPKIIRLYAGDKWKITKANLREAVTREIESDYLAAD